MAIKSEYKDAETRMETIEKKVKEHKKRWWTRLIIVIVVALAIVILFELITSMRSYSNYSVINYSECSDTGAAKYESFKGNILEYSNDGANFKKPSGELIWNQAYDMTTPTITKCEDYMAIYDKGGTTILILRDTGIVEKIDTSKPIQKVKIAAQGSVAVILKTDSEYDVKLYDKKGKELAGGEYHGNKGGFPVDIAISNDAKKMAVSLIDINSGKVGTTLNFYNFGSVGQNKIDNNVGSFSYEDTIIPEIYYTASDKMIGISNNAIYYYTEKEVPKLREKVKINNTIKSVFYNDKYVGLVLDKDAKSNKKHIVVYDGRGKIAMENDTKLAYSDVEFLDNNEVCIKNASECEIFTMYSIRKLKTKFQSDVLKVMSQGSARNYVFIEKGEMQEVKLR